MQPPTRPAHVPSVLRLGRPDADTVALALAASRQAPLSYPFVGATSGELPPGWDHDAEERVVGRGAGDWAAAKEAVRRWIPFALGWVHVHHPETPVREGELVSFSSRQFGLWTLNVCRIVDTFDDRTPAQERFGFAYGTLAGHVVAGEERFLATWDRATDMVRFEIRKFSRPNHPLVRLAGPLARHAQRRFTVEALDAMARAITEAR